MTTTFQIGDKVKVLEFLGDTLLPSLEKYIGLVGEVFHVETVTSPYSGKVSQALGVRFPGHARHISENASFFVKESK